MSWWTKLVNPIDSTNLARVRPRPTSYWNEFRVPAEGDPGRVSPPDSHFLRLHWTADAEKDARRPARGDLVFLLQNLTHAGIERLSSPRQSSLRAVKEGTFVIVVHLVEVLDEPMEVIASTGWWARRVRAWFSAPFAVAPLAEELLDCQIEHQQSGALSGLPRHPNDPNISELAWRAQVLDRLELPHLG